MQAAIEVRAELDPVLGDLSAVRQAKDLKPAGIGQDRPRPVHEPVKSAGLADDLDARPQHQMVCVGEEDLGTGCRDVFGGK